MPSVERQIRGADQAITRSIAALKDDRGLLSLNVLSQLRNLVEGAAVRLHTGENDSEYTYDAIQDGLAFVGSAKKRIQFIHRFHKLLQESVSHYTMDGDTPERLMLKYYEYLIRLRELLQDDCGMAILTNLEDFPVDLDPSLREYHEKIAQRIAAVRANPTPGGKRDRYYIHRTRPFFAKGRILYEVVFRPATDRVNKFDRIIAFTDVDMTDKYAAYLTVVPEAIDVLGQTMPISVILDWHVSIRPCEFNNFARLFGMHTTVQSGSSEYRALMEHLTRTESSLLDAVALSDKRFEKLRADATARVQKAQIFPVLEQVRVLVAKESAGHNVIRYLMLRMNNVILKQQYSSESWSGLSNLNLQFGCKPFDSMPFCSSPMGHNARLADLVESLDSTAHKHELLARRVKNNVEQHGLLYTPVEELENFGDLPPLIAHYNSALYYKHRPRRDLVEDKGHLFLQGYEDDTVEIIKELQQHSKTGIGGYSEAVERWLQETTAVVVDDPLKVDALKLLFKESQVALIYGAAGTGKSTIINQIANYFNDKRKLFLAQTNPAVNNLERRVTAQNSEFRTIARETWRPSQTEYDILIIDECSTVSNEDLLKLLTRTKFKLLVLVGDVYQIESIKFGNWFRLAPAFLPSASIFELTNPYRTKNKNLLKFWGAVRALDPDIEELLAHYGYSTVLDETLFEPQREDEIILCLNYDGLYGINNINRFLQSRNQQPEVTWGVSTYKVGDPVLFYDTERFRGVIYNNLKGKLVAIEHHAGRIQFDVDIDRIVTEFDVFGTELEWISGSVVRFSVYERGNSDEDDEGNNSSVPFQVAYAVSIHKAQGLEYESVKVVITNANEDEIPHSIFYTAVTRARRQLKIFWTPETQKAVLSQLARPENGRDLGVLESRRGLKPKASVQRKRVA
ncbi:ATP-dependent DNA helicase [Cryobacterium zhongshanensis]|uniref:ATP-dependent RecD-like DNA helicase n=1 Tax=Cryobacterium zhongshanensis TaxID=2928153 RepID=A0AA41QWW0_9MICO|nr:ATP-dependent RecD-like DNA helicase [Cryobacterium zhongshanensis]MCI4658934.1 ATP-dependent RecD-like DNA helicase [Cryobacterium zhongshanensis]